MPAEPVHLVVTQLLFELGLDAQHALAHGPPHGAAPFGELNPTRALVVGVDPPIQVAQLFTPGVFGPAYFHQVAEVLDASPGGPPNLDDLFRVMSRHGLTPAIPEGPPTTR
jgi:hypothetical protein